MSPGPFTQAGSWAGPDTEMMPLIAPQRAYSRPV